MLDCANVMESGLVYKSHNMHFRVGHEEGMLVVTAPSISAVLVFRHRLEKRYS
jgi:hypothetical protein